MDIKKSFKGKTFIKLEEIKFFYKCETQKELKKIIDDLVAQNIIVPVGKNLSFEQPQIHKKFKFVKEDNSFLKKELEGFKRINVSYYASREDEYLKDREALNAIDSYFFNRPLKNICLSANERSLEIFGDEKFLLGDGQRILKNIKRKNEDFDIYICKEIFMYYKNNINSKNVLIIENKDTWTTIKKILIDKLLILGYDFNTVIYGEGKKIISSFEYISDAEFNDFNSLLNNFLYFGDVDSSGLNIFYELKKKFPEYNIKPFKEAYNFLINNINNFGHMKYKNNKEKQDNNIHKEIVEELFPTYDCDMIYQFCKDGKIIPQEALNNRILRGYKNEL